MILNFIIQSSVFPFIEIINIKPDSLLIITTLLGLFFGNPIGIVTGFIGGFLQDCFFGNVIGLHIMQYMLIGYFSGLINEKVRIDNILIPLISVVVANVLKQIIMIIYSFFSRSGIALSKAIYGIIIPEFIYTILLMPLLYFAISRLHRLKFMRKKRRFTKEI